MKNLHFHRGACRAQKDGLRHWPPKSAHFGAVMLSLGLAACSTKGSATDPVASAPKSKSATSQHALATSREDAVRFLEQATFGPTQADIQHLYGDLGGDFNAWLNEQFSLYTSNYPDTCCDGSRADTTCFQQLACSPGDFYALSQAAPADCAANTPCRRDNYSMWRLQQIFYVNALLGPDQLRQRMAFALNQIDVTAATLNTLNYANRMNTYLRLLQGSAFGNYRQLLYDISRDAAMGVYLDNVTNQRTQLNENYAREIMQLFSIGLVVLNADGTSDQTPSYGQDTVVELTRALTGWVLAPRLAHNDATNQDVPNYRDQLVANAGRHDTGAKVLFAGSPFQTQIPANQTVDEDLNSAVDALFNHPNVGPFMGKLLIQMFVTSNPSPQYVANVTAAFNNNGAGVRGDMQAVISAVLLDPEARNPSPGPEFGKLREPVLAVTNLLRNVGWWTQDQTADPDPVSDLALVSPGGTPTTYMAQGQDVFRSPTVFNFFPPDFPLPGAPTRVGPEFGILSTATTLGRQNLIWHLINGDVAAQALYRPNFIKVDPTPFQGLAGDPAGLVEALNQRLLHGTLTNDLRSIFVNALSGSTGDQQVSEAIYLVAGSAAYQVQR